MVARPDREREETSSAASSVAVPAWTLTTLVGFLTFLLFVYAIHWVLLPIIVAGVIAYICTPLIDLLSRYGPRTLMAVAVFLALLAISAGLALLGLPALIAESSQVLSDFGGTIKRLVQGVIGNRTVAPFGQPMDASQITASIVSSARNWVKEGGTLVDLASWSFGAFFGFILTLVLLLYFLIGGQSIGRGLLWLAPPAHRDIVDHIWRSVDPELKRYFVGVFVIVLFTSIAAYMGLGVILGIHQAEFLTG
jgi:predicted PurR-regulated permease PerM